MINEVYKKSGLGKWFHGETATKEPGWDRYNSEKICELAYARIQGTTNLMDHFQNSSSQVRARASSKGDERKKSNVELDEDAMKDINKIIDHQKV